MPDPLHTPTSDPHVVSISSSPAWKRERRANRAQDLFSILMRSHPPRPQNPGLTGKSMPLSPHTIVDNPKSVSIRKGVRFQHGGFAVEYIPNDLKKASDMSDKEKSSIWWQDTDYYIFKKTSKMIACEMRRRQSAEFLPSSYSSILQRTYSVCCQTAEGSNDACPLSEKDRNRLEQSSEHSISRRGLERWSFPTLAKERLKRKGVAIRGVIEVQNRFVKGMNLDFNTGAEFIRKSSEQLTRSTRLFARALGEADSIVPRSKCNES